jgi:hypothetical protein
MTDTRPMEGDDLEKAWQKDTADVLAFLASLDRLDRWMGLPADEIAQQAEFLGADEEVDDG